MCARNGTGPTAMRKPGRDRDGGRGDRGRAPGRARAGTRRRSDVENGTGGRRFPRLRDGVCDASTPGQRRTRRQRGQRSRRRVCLDGVRHGVDRAGTGRTESSSAGDRAPRVVVNKAMSSKHCGRRWGGGNVKGQALIKIYSFRD